jgi:hypothetical protein
MHLRSLVLVPQHLIAIFTADSRATVPVLSAVTAR